MYTSVVLGHRFELLIGRPLIKEVVWFRIGRIFLWSCYTIKISVFVCKSQPWTEKRDLKRKLHVGSHKQPILWLWRNCIVTSRPTQIKADSRPLPAVNLCSSIHPQRHCVAAYCWKWQWDHFEGSVFSVTAIHFQHNLTHWLLGGPDVERFPPTEH